MWSHTCGERTALLVCVCVITHVWWEDGTIGVCVITHVRWEDGTLELFSFTRDSMQDTRALPTEPSCQLHFFKVFYLHDCVCGMLLCRYVHMCVGMCVCVCTCRPVSDLGCLPWLLSILFTESGSLTWTLRDWSRQLVCSSRNSLSYLLNSGITSRHPGLACTDMGAGGLNYGLHTYLTSILPIKLSPQPYIQFSGKKNWGTRELTCWRSYWQFVAELTQTARHAGSACALSPSRGAKARRD